jgi:hypothetical protein
MLTMFEQPVRARIDASGRQTIEVTIRAGYRPGSIIARAGLPIRVVFRREDEDECTERVVFSAPRLVRQIAITGTTTVDLPARPPGDIRFTCAMGRYRGRIEVVAERRANVVSPLISGLARHAVPLRIALVSGFLSLVPLVVAAMLAADPIAFLIAAAVVLLAWVAVCSYRARSPTFDGRTAPRTHQDE